MNTICRLIIVFITVIIIIISFLYNITTLRVFLPTWKGWRALSNIMQHEVSYEGSIIHVHMHPHGLMYMYIKCQSSHEKDAEQDSTLISPQLTGLMLYTLTHLPRQLGRLGNKHLTYTCTHIVHTQHKALWASARHIRKLIS